MSDLNDGPDPEDTIEVPGHEDFGPHCLDLYAQIKFGSRKDRKRAAKELVLFAVSFEQAFVEADNKLHEVNRARHHEIVGKEEAPAADVPAAPSDPSTAGASLEPSCVIDEHAHGDD